MVTLGGLLACSRTSSNDSSKWSFAKAKNTDTTSWQVKCDALCDVKAKGSSLEALCAATVDATRDQLGSTKCEARKSVGFPVIPASAVTDAAIVELTPASGDHHAFFALKTLSGWQLARPLGAASSFRAVEAAPVDLPGIEPAAVQLRVAMSGKDGNSERLFVCGLTGSGTTECPVAVEVASSKSAFAQMGAGMADAVRGGDWRAEVEITPKGFVAKKVAGNLPEGLAGNHAFDTSLR